MRQDHAVETRYDEAAQQQQQAQLQQQHLAEWQKVDRRLRAYAGHRATLDAAEMFDLVRAEQLKVHYLYGHVHMYEYMERALGYTPHAARERLRVARALSELPSTTAALARGELSYSGVRELTRVATADTEDTWLAASKGMVTGQIEKLVSGHVQGDRPGDPTTPDLRPRIVRIELSPEVYALWRQARAVLAEERGTELGDADLIETLCRAVIAPGSGAAGQRTRLHISSVLTVGERRRMAPAARSMSRPRWSRARVAMLGCSARSMRRRRSVRRRP